MQHFCVTQKCCQILPVTFLCSCSNTMLETEKMLCLFNSFLCNKSIKCFNTVGLVTWTGIKKIMPPQSLKVLIWGLGAHCKVQLCVRCSYGLVMRHCLGCVTGVCWHWSVLTLLLCCRPHCWAARPSPLAPLTPARHSQSLCSVVTSLTVLSWRHPLL